MPKLSALNAYTRRATRTQQVAQLSQRDRAAGWDNHLDIFGQQSNRILRPFPRCDVMVWIRKKSQITPFKVIQGHQGWYQSRARMRLPISD